MCEKGMMAGEFLPTELHQIFEDAAMQAGRFWQAITIRLRRCTLLLVALYLQPDLGPVGENMRRLAMCSGNFWPLPRCHGLSWATGIVNRRICSRRPRAWSSCLRELQARV